MATAVTAVFFSFLVVVLVAGMMVMTPKRFPPLPVVLAMNMLLGLIVALYFVLISLRPGWQLLFVLVLVALVVWSNGGAYKYQIPGMGTVNGESLYKAKLVPVNSSPVEIPGPQEPLLDGFDVLNAWKVHLLVGFELQLMSSLNGVSGIPTEGKNLIILAVVDQVMYFRIYDGVGRMVVNTDEMSLTGQAWRIEALKKQLQGLWPPYELTRCEKDRLIAEVSSIAFRPKLVMVAVTGGAYRAAFWTAAVLDELDHLSRPDAP